MNGLNWGPELPSAAFADTAECVAFLTATGRGLDVGAIVEEQKKAQAEEFAARCVQSTQQLSAQSDHLQQAASQLLKELEVYCDPSAEVQRVQALSAHLDLCNAAIQSLRGRQKL